MKNMSIKRLSKVFSRKDYKGKGIDYDKWESGFDLF